MEPLKMRSDSTDPRIIVVGAGPSGIAAAARLIENGLKNVTILEAESRIGGRIHTAKLGDSYSDLGAQWVHGERGNVVFEMAHPTGLLDRSDEHEKSFVQEYVDSKGNILDDNIVKSISKFHEKYTEYMNSSDEGDFDGPSSESIGDYVEREFNETFKNQPEILKERLKYLHHLELGCISLESTDSWHKLPVSSTDDYVEYPGDQMMNWKNRGYSTVLDLLIKRYPDSKKELPISDKIILDSQVKTIDYSKVQEGNAIRVMTADGRNFEADHVIVTVSLGVLKEEHKTLFVPPLPSNKTRAIEGFGYGNVAKVYLLFRTPFWTLKEGRILRYNFMWNDDDRREIEKTEKEWTLGILGAMTVEHKPNVLELWIPGKYALMMENQSEDKVLDHSSEVLDKFLSKTLKVGKPIALLRSCWYSNPHFRGTYKHSTIETIKMKVTPRMLEEPVVPSNLTLLFAGEAVSADRYGTVDGAIKSGWRAADRLLSHYKKLAPSNE